MARPAKNNCEYFPHDGGMRNHRKVKAIRGQFPNGYAIWSMLLEYLTDSDGNEFEFSDLELQIMSGDFGFTPEEIKGVINYCLQLEMLFEKNGFIYSESLNEKLAPVYEKRGRAREISKKQYRKNGKYSTDITDDTVVSVAEMPHSKVNRIEENRTIIEANASIVETVVSTSEEKLIKNDWDQLPKSKKEVYSFIVQRQPKFIEPYVSMWNIWAKDNGKPQVSTINKFRRSKFRVRIREDGFDFIGMLTKATKSEMCLSGSWFNFDFLIKNETGYTKLLEGNYDNGKAKPTEQPTGILDEKLATIFGENKQ